MKIKHYDYYTGFLLVFAVLTLVHVMSGCDFDYKTAEERGIQVNRDIIAIYNQDKSMLLFENMVEDEFNVRLDNVWRNSEVWWADTSCQGRDGYGIQLGRKCVAGVMWDCSDLYVALSDRDPLRTCGTALLHEFGHCLNGYVFGHRAGDHKGPMWDVVDAANQIACDRGW